MTEKEALLRYMDDPIITAAKNSMGCNENWYNPYYAIMQVFSREQIIGMSNAEINHLVRLADEISNNLY